MIRIIGGKHRSRLISTPNEEVVLPTKNMVREAIFSILGHRVMNAVVVDLFAGSGALGLEAVSRGAKRAYFSDSHPSTIKVISANIATLKEEYKCEVHLCDFKEMIDYLENNQILVDIVFIDPPYEAGYYDAVLEAFFASELLQKGAKLVVESRHEIDHKLLKNYDARHYRYGITHLLVITI